MDCVAGTRVVSVATASDHAYACPTKPLADYVGAVYRLLVLEAGVLGHIPALDPVTNEPNAGEFEPMIVRFRKAAKVASYHQALARCQLMQHSKHYTIDKNDTDDPVIFVKERNKGGEWVPKAVLKVDCLPGQQGDI